MRNTNGKKILVSATNYSVYCAEAKDLLEKNGFQIIENTLGRPFTFDELKRIVPDIDAVVAGVDQWSEPMFRLAPKLKIIVRFGVGVDNIDLKAAKSHGVLVTNAKGENAAAVAEQAVGLMLAMLRNLPGLDASVRRGEWKRFVGHNMDGLEIGLLGFGSIARQVVKKLCGFHVKIRAYDKYPDLQAAEKLRVEICSLEDVLKYSDIVSLHLPNLPETKHIMNEKTFSMMKKEAYFLNTARGALVDENALTDALKTHRIAMAAADVYENEPVEKENPLLQIENFICTPHTCGDTYETYRSISLITANAILDFFRGGSPKNLLNA